MDARWIVTRLTVDRRTAVRYDAMVPNGDRATAGTIEMACNPAVKFLQSLDTAADTYRATQQAAAVYLAAQRPALVGQRMSAAFRRSAILERRRANGQARAEQLEALARLIDRICSRIALCVPVAETSENFTATCEVAVRCLDHAGAPPRTSSPRNLEVVAAA
jgi:hypothetical protein